MAIKVYGNLISTATMRIRACLNEKSIDYELVAVDMRSGEHKKEPFLSLNPFGQIPAFEDGDLTLFESRAITRYIAQAYAGKGTPLLASPTVDVWMEVEAQKYDPPAAKLTWEFIKPTLGMTTDEGVVEEQQQVLARVLDVYERRLAQSKFLGGATFSLADLHHLPILDYLMATPVKAVFESRPHVSAWVKEILARPSWHKVVASKI